MVLTVPTPRLEQRLDANLKEHRILQTQHDTTRGLWVKRRHWFLQPVSLALCSKCPSHSPAHPSRLQAGKDSASAWACEEEHAAKRTLTHTCAGPHAHTDQLRGSERPIRIQQSGSTSSKNELRQDNQHKQDCVVSSDCL